MTTPPPESKPAHEVRRVDPDRRALLALALLLGLSAAFFLARKLAVGRGMNFIVWNLFLAVIPVAAAWFARRYAGRTALFILCGAVWLVFFPNAPYIATDLMHIRTARPANLWLDVLVLGSAATTGFVAGLVSLRWIHGALLMRRIRPSIAWGAVAVACLAAGFGVFLGRFQRWNTWDIVTRPTELLADAWSALGEASVLGFSLLFSLAVAGGYATMTVFVGPPTGAPVEPGPTGGPALDG